MVLYVIELTSMLSAFPTQTSLETVDCNSVGLARTSACDFDHHTYVSAAEASMMKPRP